MAGYFGLTGPICARALNLKMTLHLSARRHQESRTPSQGSGTSAVWKRDRVDRV